MYLTQLFNFRKFEERYQEGWVRMQTHPDLPLAILNYTDKTQHNWAWDDVTKKCRGLIFNVDTLEIVARPFDKFFNLHEMKQSEIEPLKVGKVRVTDKVDGSLGIMYPTSDGYAIATRGSFTSEQAVKATEILHRKYPSYKPPRNYTVLFEIVYPENRIVLDYGDTEDLVLLGMVHIPTGITSGPEMAFHWPGPKAETFHYHSFEEALNAPPRTNAEGIVIHHEFSDVRVKLKQDDYVTAHRVVFGLDERAVWEWLTDHDDVEGLIRNLPEEFAHWTYDVMETLTFKHTNKLNDAEDLLRFSDPYIRGEREHRKAFATAIKDQPKDVKAVAFALYDGQDKRAEETAWKAVRPAKGKTAQKGMANV